jgi:hypothetical protein
MIAILQANHPIPEALMAMGEALAHKFDKELKIIVPSNITLDSMPHNSIVFDTNEAELDIFCDTHDISFLLLQCTDNGRKNIQKLLNATRNLRIPYMIHKQNQSLTLFEHIFVPITYLEEEVEKAQFAAAFGRFFKSNVQIFVPKDAGSKAQRNCDRIVAFLEKFDISKTIHKGQKDSFGIESEVCALAENQANSLVLLSASREYGLDDIIFGPKELKLIRKTNTPILLINPRADLYALCD